MTTTTNLIEAAGSLEGERAARAVWSTIAEPNDPIIGRLITAHGPVDALGVALDGAESDVEGVDALRKRVIPRASADVVRRAVDVAQRVGAQMITPDSPEWPLQVEDLGAASPVALWVRGNLEALAARNITTLTGARAATSYGEHAALELANGLIDREHTLIAGGAYGIDAVVHRASLAAEVPGIAVLAGGVDRFYPAGHDNLLTRLTEHGAVVSEVACDAAPTKWRFISRNRITAALAGWTVIVEAGPRSGSLNVAAHAIALGRPVGSVPGPITSPASHGANRLIREGARLIASAADIN